jgi:fructokinase
LDPRGEILLRHRIPTPKNDYQALLIELNLLIRHVENASKQKLGVPCHGTVGLGIPGSLAPGTNLLRNSNLQIINGKPLAIDLSALLGQEVRIENDANCFALSEAVDGAGKGAQVVFGVILGTGCGGGLVLHQKIWRGPNALGGEWGHNRLPDPNHEEWNNPPPCYCGHKGCIETYVSGTGFKADFLKATGKNLESQEIVALSFQGDREALQALDRLENRLARSLAVLINAVDPDVIVLGGGLSNVDRLYEKVPKIWEQFIFGDGRFTKLLKAVHGDSSGVRGAAWLWGSKSGS